MVDRIPTVCASKGRRDLFVYLFICLFIYLFIYLFIILIHLITVKGSIIIELF